MTTLGGTILLDRAVLFEVVEDPNVTPRYVVSGTAGSVGGGGSKTDSYSVEGAFRSYGNGNTRLVLGSSNTRTQAFALRALTPSQVAVVQALVGHTVCYRDTYGRRVFGAFLALTITDIPFSGRFEDDTLLTDVGLTIQSTTYDEAV
jgi:hypothetical protein